MDYKHVLALVSTIALLLIGAFLYLEENPLTKPVSPFAENETETTETFETETQGQETQENSTETTETTENTQDTQDTQEIQDTQDQQDQVIDITTKQGLSDILKQTADQDDYENFAKYLKIAYQNLWETDELFSKIESDLYVKAAEQYFDQNNITRALEASSIVYEQVPQSWRFRYLKIRSLEKQGRDALAQNDLATAEAKAMAILQMLYRREGADLLADVYIQKIQANIQDADQQLALENIYFIWDYEVSDVQREQLTDLRNTALSM